MTRSYLFGSVLVHEGLHLDPLALVERCRRGAGQFVWDVVFVANVLSLLDPESTRVLVRFVVEKTVFPADGSPFIMPQLWDSGGGCFGRRPGGVGGWGQNPGNEEGSRRTPGKRRHFVVVVFYGRCFENAKTKEGSGELESSERREGSVEGIGGREPQSSGH